MSIDIEKNKEEKIKNHFTSKGYESIDLVDGNCLENSFRGVVLGKKDGKFYLLNYACVFNNVGNIIASSITPKLADLDSLLVEEDDELNGTILIFAKGNKVITYVSKKNIIKESNFLGKRIEGTLALSYASDDFEHYFLSINNDTICLNRIGISENGEYNFFYDSACILPDIEEITDYNVAYTINDYARAADCVCYHIAVTLTYKNGKQR